MNNPDEENNEENEQPLFGMNYNIATTQNAFFNVLSELVESKENDTNNTNENETLEQQNNPNFKNLISIENEEDYDDEYDDLNKDINELLKEMEIDDDELFQIKDQKEINKDSMKESIKEQKINETNEKETMKSHPWNDPKYIKTKRDNQDYEIYQQIVMIALLTEKASITIEKPNKSSKKSVTTPKIIEITFEDKEPFDIIEFSQSRCIEMCRDEIKNGVSQSKALRRLEKNKKVYIQTLLIDMIKEIGFTVKSSLSRKSNKSLQTERIESIEKENELHLNKENIIEIGQKVNDYFLSEIKKTRKVVIPQNDAIVHQIIYGK